MSTHLPFPNPQLHPRPIQRMQQSVQGQTFLLRGLWWDGQRRLRRRFFAGTEETLVVGWGRSTKMNLTRIETFWLAFTDCLVSEQHPPAVAHDPSGHSWADSRLWPLPGARGLVQQLQASCLFRSKVQNNKVRKKKCFCSHVRVSSLQKWKFKMEMISLFLFSEQDLFFFYRSGRLTSAETAPLKAKQRDSTSALSNTNRYPPEESFHSPPPLESFEVRAPHLTSPDLVSLSFGQACVRGRALRSILAVRNISREEAEKIVDEVFDTCFKDHAPFGRIPHSKKDAQFAYRDYENRDRYYANL